MLSTYRPQGPHGFIEPESFRIRVSYYTNLTTGGRIVYLFISVDVNTLCTKTVLVELDGHWKIKNNFR